MHNSVLAILNFHVAQKHSTKFRFNQTYISGGDVVFKSFKMARMADIFDIKNERISAILNLHDTLMTHIKFKLNLTYVL